MTTTPVPETIGRYRVLRPLGAGAMGAVYLAEDPLLKRRVAVKVVQMAGGAVDQARQRFAREAEISARLNHPNVITIYDVGEDPKSGPFLAMEFVDGSSLADVIKAGGLDDAARLRILVLAMQGLEAAHVAGIVHRDVKPSNLMIGGDGRVKLMDFGIARDEDVGMTATGAMIGTPAYIAPEQLKGLPPSMVTDRYAFAVTAFELFTGARPFQADTASAMLFAIVNDPPRIPPGMRPALGQAFARALAKNPSERPATLRDFLDQLIAAAALNGPLRARVQALLDAASPLPAAAAATVAEATALLDTAATAKATLTVVTGGGAAAPAAEPPGLAPGIGLGPILGVVGVLAVATVVAAWFLHAGHESPEPTPPVVVARVATPAVAPPTARPAPTERAPTARPEPTAPPEPTVAAEPTTARPTAAPAAAATQAPVLEPTVGEPTNVVRLQTNFAVAPTPTAPSLTPREFEALVRRELGRRDLTHVMVRVDKEHRVRLANLTDRSEEREARSAVAAAAPELRVVSAEIRPAAEPTAVPGWGAIRSEGAERSE